MASKRNDSDATTMIAQTLDKIPVFPRVQVAHSYSNDLVGVIGHICLQSFKDLDSLQLLLSVMLPLVYVMMTDEVIRDSVFFLLLTVLQSLEDF